MMQNIKFNNYMPTKNNIVKIYSPPNPMNAPLVYIPPELATYGEEFINNVMMDVCQKMNDPKYDKIMVFTPPSIPYEEFHDNPTTLSTTDEIYECVNPLYKLKQNDDIEDIIIHIDDKNNNENYDKQNITIMYVREINDDLNELIL